MGELVEDPEVRLLSEPVPEVGEEAVTRCLVPESVCSGGLVVVFEA